MHTKIQEKINDIKKTIMIIQNVAQDFCTCEGGGFAYDYRKCATCQMADDIIVVIRHSDEKQRGIERQMEKDGNAGNV